MLIIKMYGWSNSEICTVTRTKVFSTYCGYLRKLIVNHCPLQNICSVTNTAGFLFDAYSIRWTWWFEHGGLPRPRPRLGCYAGHQTLPSASSKWEVHHFVLHWAFSALALTLVQAASICLPILPGCRGTTGHGTHLKGEGLACQLFLISTFSSRPHSC